MARIRTRARALDMLGRQQIAGIPTALSELFKNSHDAYADNVEVDYVRKKNLLILRDDGLGMTKAEFEDRWLTIGTDSKLIDEDSIDQPAIDTTKCTRPIMGEKGIGRLAIAAIGPQVLVLTRSRRNGELGNLVAAFVNWTLFSFPALDLEDIEIPIIEIEGGINPTKAQVDGLLKQSVDNVRSLSEKISKKKIEHVCKQITGFEYDPEYWTEQLSELDSSLDLNRGPLRLDGAYAGAHFIVSPADENLNTDIEEIAKRGRYGERIDRASRLEKLLSGFTNTMYPDSLAPIIARFRDHTLEGECVDRISESNFFTPKEFEIADHHFDGRFDEFGQFNGVVQVYGEKHEAIIPWHGGNNLEVSCGPFKIKLAYVQGAQRDSKIAPELWGDLAKKAEMIGGLYVYRDNIRVLPYGDNDFDFLKIEQRRSKSASEYFFSYRRMFGAIELTKEFNSTLKEKAGREGFIENKAYKQLKAILENFFIQVAADFFREKGELSDVFIETRARQQAEHEALKKRSKQKTAKKKAFHKLLVTFFEKLDAGEYEQKIERFSSSVEKLFLNFEPKHQELDDFVFEVESFVQSTAVDFSKKIEISQPKGVGFGKEITDYWDRYRVERAKLLDSLAAVKDTAGRKLVELEDRYGDRTGLRRRFDDSIQAQQDYHTKQLNVAYSKVNDAVADLQQQVKALVSENKRKAKSTLEGVSANFASTSFAGRSSDELYEIKKDLESKIEVTSKEIVDKVETLTEQLNTARDGQDEHTVASSTLVAALESEYEHLKEQHERNLEMVQLGMALSVINHEFNGNVLSIRRGLNDMQPFAKRSEKFKVIYGRVRTGFDHLDGYLRTFTPLTRRLARRRTDITGKAVSEFVVSVFDERSKEAGIELVFTSSFLQQKIFSFTSTIYPAFVNLIDNAIHWLEKSTGEKIITLDATEKGFLVKDSGPGIPTIDQENVFEFGFSRRTGGQGMGLYVSRETLAKDGFKLELNEYHPDCGAVFVLEPESTDEEVK